ncbi:MAG: transcriptional activator NhaR [Planctomycetes bacterium]|nr:transcriptional activator NhaR [Planctomycetota bacterium]
MEWLNYHHFMYFWVVAKEGSIVKASEKLLLAHPTISGQIHRLEESLGVKLFAKRGRGLVLTEAGQTAYRYADEIFSLGNEFMDAIQGRGRARGLRLVVGVADVLPPSLVRRFLEPAFKWDHGIQIVCRSDKSLDEFLAELALYRVDVVIADRAASPIVAVRVFSHLLGECDTTFFATPALAKTLRRKFPGSLDGAPFLMPGAPSAVRRSLEDWFDMTGIKPLLIAACDDSALTKDLGSNGMGIFAVPSVIETEVKRQYNVAVVGRTAEVRQQFYAISVERKIKHPAVKAITDAARNAIFAKK